MEVSGQHHAPAALPPGKNPGNHPKGGWMGPRAGLDDLSTKSLLPLQGFETRIVRPET